MHCSVKGFLFIGLLIGQFFAALAQDTSTCPAMTQDGCDHWTWGNQANWKTFCSHYATCGTGLQSPIDIPTSSLTCGTSCVRPEFHYNTRVSVGLFNIEQTLAVVPNAGNYLNWEGVKYDLQWIEFRQPSEHSLGGKFSDLEAQFWHMSQDGAWIAVAVLYNIDSDEENVFFATFWDFLPEHSDCFCGNGRIEQGEECDDAELNSNTIPDRCRLTCELPYCGDLVVDRGEQCDKGAGNNNTLASTSTTDSLKACRTDCRFSHCGDRVVDLGEDCDDGNFVNGDGCTSYCTTECGNGRVDGGEQCDSGTSVNNQKLADGCRPGCIRAYCGDGVKDSGEQCDQGTANSDTIRNACRTNCRNPYCGDGVVDTNEQCDPLFNSLCTSNCTTITPNCGNNRLDAGEQCDQGTQNSNTVGAKCRTDCTLPFCGDLVKDVGSINIPNVAQNQTYNEGCDVGPLGSTTCSNCQLTCGNGVLNSPEQCDLGGGVGSEPNHGNKPNQCRKGCIAPACGDGVIDNGEECDMGTSNGLPTSSCTLRCTWKKCGDGVVDSQVTDRTKESCDDSNTNDGDGCSSVCQKECGDGVITGNEQCDMGSDNANAANKCKLTCQLPRCGDGYKDFDEECDYAAPGYSLLNCRQTCKVPYCGDAIVDSAMGEACDKGFAGNSDIEVGGCSTRCTMNECGYYSSSAFGDLNLAMACTGCFYSYMGSSTRPPCNGGVMWFVAQQVQKVSQFQIDQFHYIWGTSVKRSQQGTCNLDDKYSTRMCNCESNEGSVTTMARAACTPVPRKPALQTTLDILKSTASAEGVLHAAIHQLVALLVREPLYLPTYYTSGTGASIIACETEAFYNRGHTDLSEAVATLRAVGTFNVNVQDEALTALIFFEHVLQFYESLQILTAPRSPTGSLSNALALMIGTGAASPFLPYNYEDQSGEKQTVTAEVDVDAPVLIQKAVSGLQARLFRGAVGFNVDPEIHRFSNIPDETIWYVRFVGVEYLKQYGYKNNNGTVSFNLSDEKVILESNILNLWNYVH